MQMNRARFNHMRHERENDGLSQVLQGPNAQTGMGSTLNSLRKTTFTRTELMQRPPVAPSNSRPKRLCNVNPGNRPAATVAADATGNRRAGGGRAHFLPRVARLNNNSNSNNISNNTSNSNPNSSLYHSCTGYMTGSFTPVGANNKTGLLRNKSPFKKQGKLNSQLSNSYEEDLDKATLLQQQQQQQQQTKAQQAEEDEQLEVSPEQQLNLIRAGGAAGLGVALGNSCCSSSSSIMSTSSNELRQIKMAKAFQLPEEHNQSFIYLCKPDMQVTELVIARQLRNSGERVNEQLEVNDGDGVGEGEDEGDGEDQDNNEAVSESDDSSNESRPPRFLREPDSEQLDEKPEEEAQPELELALELESQLMDVRQRQQKLQLLAEQAMQLTEQQEEAEPVQAKDSHAVKVDMQMVWQNLPTLQREIKLLQLLGEKMEATLRANHKVTCPGSARPLTSSESNTEFFTPRSNLTLYARYNLLPIAQMGFLRVEQLQHLCRRARIQYHARSLSCAREYRIETKTLTELKTADEMQCFYMPLAEGGGLQRTSFRMLRENPNVLLQQLRPLSPARPFNLLEHDAMFFNSMLGCGELQSVTSTQMQSVPVDRVTGGAASSQLPSSRPTFSLPPYSRLSVRPAGQRDCLWSHEEMRRLLLNEAGADHEPELPKVTEQLLLEPDKDHDEKPPQLEEHQEHPEHPEHPGHPELQEQLKLKLIKRSQPRQVAPLKSPGIEMEPRIQTQLLKTVLVGIIQVAVFLVLIMAFTYPDARC